MRLGRDSMTSFNQRGCDEIMCQFIKNLDSSYDIDYGVKIDEVIEPNNDSSVNIETLE